MDFKALEEFLSVSNIITNQVFDTLLEFMNYNSNGMKVSVAKLLGVVRDRIENNEHIILERTNVTLTLVTFDKIVEEYFGEIISDRIKED